MPATTPRSVGVVGCGRWGQNIVRDLVTLGCSVAVVARSEGSRARALDAGASAVVDEVSGLTEVDGVVVATPTATHFDVISSLLESGVPIFTEKPMTCDLARANELVEKARDRLFVMDKWRYHPGVERLRDIAASGEIGDLLGIQTRRLGWGNPHGDVDAAWILLPHDLSIVLEILGEIPDVVSAKGVSKGDDVMTASVHLGASVPVMSEISSLSPSNHRSVTIFGSHGMASLEGGWSNHIARYSPGSTDGEPELESISEELPLLRELRAFVEHLGGGPPPRSSATEGALTVARVARARELILSDR